MPDYQWKPIEPLSDEDRSIDLAAAKPLYETWRSAEERLKSESRENLDQFTQRLIRRLSIETGILERLYDLDRGTTEALVTKGFYEELVSRSSTDIEPSRLIDLLRDQEAAIQLVMDIVSGNRSLSIGTIHELHVILTGHQEFTTAVDPTGRRIDIRLTRGQFKEQPNNPKRPDGTVHEYCPPLQVSSEVERLLKLLSDYGDEDPVIVSAWFHHRFTQIHPYQDGNGRVARALTTLILLKARLLPLVIDRDLRVEYLEALEAADFGDLTKLASLFARLERTAILQALSVDADTEIGHERRLTAAVIENLAAKFNRRRAAQQSELRRVNQLAKKLRQETRGALDQTLEALAKSLDLPQSPEIRLTDGGPDCGNAHWYKFEVVQTAQHAGKFANFDEEHYFLKATFRVDRERLVFVTSFHHVGQVLSGIMEATAFAQLESFEDSEDRQYARQDFFPCSLEPFVFTYKTKFEDIRAIFVTWLDSVLAVALKEFGDRL